MKTDKEPKTTKPRERRKISYKANIAGRIRLFYAFIILAVVFIVGRIAYLQANSSIDRMSELLHSKLSYVDTLLPRRGSILARDGRPLAATIITRDIFFDFGSAAFTDESRFLADADSLSKCLAAFFGDKSAGEYYKIITETNARHMKRGKRCKSYTTRGLFSSKTREKVEDTLTWRRSSWTRLFREITAAEWEVVRHFPIISGGEGNRYNLVRHDRRIYPQQNLAKRIIGNDNDQGHFGLDYVYRDSLAGHKGYREKRRMSKSLISHVSGLASCEPVDGVDLVTTLDVDIQEVAHAALYDQLVEQRAKWGTCVVMECATGDILAMVNLGLNKEGDYVENFNHALGSRTEPGSTLKLAGLLALLEDAKVPLTKTYYTGMGKPVQVGRSRKKIVDSHNIHGPNNNGIVDMKEGFAESSNVYFATAVYEAYKNNPERYVDFLCGLHYDRPAGLELLGEKTPIVPHPGQRGWYGDMTLANMGYGYSIELAPIQTLTIYNAVANGGRMVAPRVVSRMERNGEVVAEFPTQTLVEKICSEETIASARECLEAVALTGTAKNFFSEKIRPYRVGVKTGTAQYAQGAISYSDHYYIGSMAGYVPADNPKYSVIAVVHKRRQPYPYNRVEGGPVAGPVVQRVMDYLYNRGTVLPLEQAGTAAQPVAVKGDIASAGTGEAMPDVRGMGLNDALYLLESRGVKVAFAGAGRVVSQSVGPGTEIRPGMSVNIELK